MDTLTHLVTADELLRMPGDGVRYELVKGVLIQMSPAGHQHGVVAMRLAWRLAQHIETNDLGLVSAAETGFLLSTNPDTVRAADIAFISKARAARVGSVSSYWPGAPDVAVEVVSPGDTYTEVEEKVQQYLDAGARAVWIVDPRRRTITTYRSLTTIAILTEDDTLDGEEIIPGFQCTVRDIFA